MQSYDISNKIRYLRLKANLTLKELAGLVGTSAPALHRYENGWHRFELQTLEKIATALGAFLEIRILPQKKIERKSMNWATAQRTQIYAYHLLKPLFWDVKIPRKQILDYQDWLLVRVLDYGNKDQVTALFQIFSFEKISSSFLKNQHKLSRKTQTAWGYFFERKNLL